MINKLFTKPRLYTSNMSDDTLIYYENNEIIKLLEKEFPSFQMGFVPDKYEVAFLLIEEDMKDSFRDKWKIAFFKKTLDVLSGGTITLDNIEAMKDAKEKFEVYKTIDGSYEDVINVSCDLISKHKANIKENSI